MSGTLTEPAEFVYEQVDGKSNEFIFSPKFERSDCCGLRSYVMVELHNRGVLYFCGHHFNKHREKLFEMSMYIRDETLYLVDNKLIGSSN